MSLDDMDKFEQKEMKKIRPVKSTWHDLFVIYLPEPMRKSECGFKDKVISPFRTNTLTQTVYGRGKKLTKPKHKTKLIALESPLY